VRWFLANELERRRHRRVPKESRQGRRAIQRAPILLIHHVGARTGIARVNPVMYLKDGARYLVFASKGGAPTTRAGTTTSWPTLTSRSRWETTRSRSWLRRSRGGERQALRAPGVALPAVRRLPEEDRPDHPRGRFLPKVKGDRHADGHTKGFSTFVGTGPGSRRCVPAVAAERTNSWSGMEGLAKSVKEKSGARAGSSFLLYALVPIRSSSNLTGSST